MKIPPQQLFLSGYLPWLSICFLSPLTLFTFSLFAGRLFLYFSDPWLLKVSFFFELSFTPAVSHTLARNFVIIGGTLFVVLKRDHPLSS